MEWPGHNAFESGRQSVRKLAHGLLEIWWELTLAVEIPERQPLVKVIGCQTLYFEMCPGKPSPIVRWPACLECPELGDFGQVGFPILNVSIENGSQFLMLSQVHVEWPDETEDSLVPAHVFVERL